MHEMKKSEESRSVKWVGKKKCIRVRYNLEKSLGGPENCHVPVLEMRKETLSVTVYLKTEG